MKIINNFLDLSKFKLFGFLAVQIYVNLIKLMFGCPDDNIVCWWCFCNGWLSGGWNELDEKVDNNVEATEEHRLCTRQSEPVSLVGLFSLNNFYFCHSDSSISHQRYILLSVVLCVFVPQDIEYPSVGFTLALRSVERFLVLEPPLK